MEKKIWYSPSKEILQNSNIKNYEKYRQDAIIEPEKFWEDAAKELEWYKPWKCILDDSKAPFYKWFRGGKTNIVHNAIDRHLKKDKNKLAIIYENEGGDSKKITYGQLNNEICKFANALKDIGLKKGDKVVTYLPNIPEQVISMLACAKLGIVHSVVYAGFSKTALRQRIEECDAKLVITADGSLRKGNIIDLLSIVKEAVSGNNNIKKIVIFNNLKKKLNLIEKGISWDEFTKGKSETCKTEEMNSNDDLFILYTSGTTGKPKGVVHDHGGYQTGVSRTLKWAFDIKEKDIFWSTSDAGWITGHSYMIYGPLLLGITTVLYDGAPTYPNNDKWWEIIDKYKISVLYTAPTAVRLLMSLGEAPIKKHKLTSLRILGSVGEPINPVAWKWLYEVIGKKKCPVIDTWWQTETGMIILTPSPTTDLKAGSVAKPFPGVEAFIVEEEAPHRIVRPDETGLLVLRGAWPAMLTGLYNHPDRYIEKYWKDIPGYYLTGDYARQDTDGYFWIEGRSDDVIKISGHRLGSAEIEDIIVSEKNIAEAAVIGLPDKERGNILEAYIMLNKGIKKSEEIKQIVKKHVREHFGPIAVFKDIKFVDSLPKTRSGKIMRRVLRAWSKGEDPGDLSTLQKD